MGNKYLETKGNSLESSILGLWKEAAGTKKDEELSKKQKKLDVDGDGEIEGSDLAKLRKKGAKKEGNAFGKALMAAKEKGDKTFVVGGKTYEVYEEADLDEVEESYEIGTNEYRDYTLEVTPGQTDPEWVKAVEFKVQSMKEALAKVWSLDEFITKDGVRRRVSEGDKRRSENDEKNDLTKVLKNGKTMTGKKSAQIDMKPKIKD